MQKMFGLMIRRPGRITAWGTKVKENKFAWRIFGIVLCLFFCVLAYWVVRYWEYMPYVDESATFSAVSNFMREGLPRVGVAKKSVMYDVPPNVQYYWTYLVEIILRVPVQLVGKCLHADNLQPITNLIFAAGTLYVLFLKVRVWLRHGGGKEKRVYVFVFDMVLLAVMCSEGFMTFAHYVRYYIFAMMTFLYSLVMIPIYLDDLNGGRNVWKAFALGMLPCIFHLLYVPYCLLVFVLTVWEMKKQGLLKGKFLAAAVPALLVAAAGAAYVLATRRTGILGMIQGISRNYLVRYAAIIISLHPAELILAAAVVVLLAAYCHRLPTLLRKAVALAGFNILLNGLFVGNGIYTYPRYCWPMRICYILLAAAALWTVTDRLCSCIRGNSMVVYMAASLCFLAWGGKQGKYAGICRPAACILGRIWTDGKFCKRGGRGRCDSVFRLFPACEFKTSGMVCVSVSGL